MPTAEIRKMSVSKKNTGYEQYTITIPKTYGSSIETLGINEFLLALNSFGGLLIPISTNAKGEVEKIKRQVLMVLPKIEALLNKKEVAQ